MSVARLISAIITQQRMMEPVTVGVSRLLMASKIKRPMPGQANTVSARTEPVMTKLNCMPTAVTMGIMALRRPC